MNKLSLAAAAALTITAGVANAAGCLTIIQAFPTLQDGYCVSYGGTTVTWLQAGEGHEENQNIGAFPTPNGFTPNLLPLFGGGPDLRVSDYLMLANSATNPGHIDVAMLSDGYTSAEGNAFFSLFRSDGSPTNLPEADETGGWQDVSYVFGLAANTVYVISDTSEVPEPAAWVMMTLGIGAIAGAARVSRRGATDARRGVVDEGQKAARRRC